MAGKLLTPKVSAILILLPIHNDSSIARMVGASREYVRQIRKIYKVPINKNVFRKHYGERKNKWKN